MSAAPFDVSFRLAADSAIARSAYVRGDITMERGALIAPGADVEGTVELGRNARIGCNCDIRGELTLGPWSNFTKDVDAIGDVCVGGYGAFARRITFQEGNHDTSKASIQMRFYPKVVGEPLEHVSDGPIEVGNDVWIGADVTVLTGVTIGDGAVVGAGAVVTKDVEPYEIVAGVPAKHRGWRFDEETRRELRDISWWEWDEERIRRNTEFFTTNLQEADDIRALIR
jgi:virginiamycin A acetyltransferase